MTAFDEWAKENLPSAKDTMLYATAEAAYNAALTRAAEICLELAGSGPTFKLDDALEILGIRKCHDKILAARGGK